MDLVAQINAQLDRLGWSSDTAPAGNSTLDAFPSETEGIIVLSDNQESTAFHGAPLLTTLETLPEDIDWDALWQEMLPHMAED